MSRRTTSPSSFRAQPTATCSPTNPPPITVIFLRIVSLPLACRRHDGLREGRAGDLARAFHLAGEVVGHRLPLHRLGEPGLHALRRLAPPQVLQEHHPREDER